MERKRREGAAGDIEGQPLQPGEQIDRSVVAIAYGSAAVGPRSTMAPLSAFRLRGAANP